MQQLTRSATDPHYEPISIELMGEIAQNSKDEPAFHQRDLQVLDKVVAYLKNPACRIQQHKLLVAVQNDICVTMTIAEWRKTHPDFHVALNDTLEWLISPGEDGTPPGLLALNLDKEAPSLCHALGSAIFNLKFKFKLRDLDRNHIKDRRSTRRISDKIKKLEELRAEAEPDESKIKKAELGFKKSLNYGKPKRIDAPAKDLEGNDIHIDISVPSSASNPANSIQDFIDYLNEDPERDLRNVETPRKTCNCHDIWLLKKSTPKKNWDEIAERLGVSVRTATTLWNGQCNSCINKLKQEFDNR
jgi:hypothetical protein